MKSWSRKAVMLSAAFAMMVSVAASAFAMTQAEKEALYPMIVPEVLPVPFSATYVPNELDEWVDLVALETFDTGWDDDWTVVDENSDGNSWLNSGETATEADFLYLSESAPFMYVDSDALGEEGPIMEEKLVSPSFSTEGLTIVELTFDCRYRSISPQEGYVQYSIDNMATWVTIETYAGADVTGLQTISLPAEALGQSDVRVAFHFSTGDDNWRWYWGIDNVLVRGFSPDVGIELHVTNVVIPELVYTGVDFDVDVTVENSGTEASGAFNIALFGNSETAPAVGDTPDWTIDVTGLASGATTTETITINYTDDGDMAFYAIVDNGEAVEEVNENNNITDVYTVVSFLDPGFFLGGSMDAAGEVNLSWYTLDNFTFSPAEAVSFPEGLVNMNLNNNTGGNVWLAGYDNADYTDCEFEATFTKNVGSESATMGMFFHADDILSSGYLIGFTATGSFIAVGIDANGGLDERFSGSDASPWGQVTVPFNTGLESQNTMTVICDGSNYEVLINGETQLTFTSEAFTTGKMMVVASAGDNMETDLDYLIYSINDTTPATVAAANAVHGVSASANTDIANGPSVTSVVNANVAARNIVNHTVNHRSELDVIENFILYRDDAEIATTTEQSYSETITESGNYTYHVKADHGTAGVSLASNDLVLSLYDYGTIAGVVRECSETGALLEGVTVALDEDVSVTTGADGAYEFTGLRTDLTYDITFTLDGYIQLTSSDIAVVSGQTTTVNVELLNPVGSTETESVVIDITINGDDPSGTGAIVIDNDGCGPLEFSASYQLIDQPWNDTAVSNVISDPVCRPSSDATRVGPVDDSFNSELDEMYDNIFSLGLETVVSRDSIFGVVSTPEGIYVSTWGPQYTLYHLDNSGVLQDSHPFPNGRQMWNEMGYDPRDGMFYMGDTGNMYKFSPDMTTFETVFTYGTADIIFTAVDYENNKIYFGTWTPSFHVYDMNTGNVTDLAAYPEGDLGNLCGIAYAPWDEGGFTVYGHASVSTGTALTKYNPELNVWDSAANLVALYNTANLGAGGLEITDGFREGMLDYITITEGNPTSVDVWEGVEGLPSWFMFTEGTNSGIVNPGESATIEITVDFSERQDLLDMLDDGDMATAAITIGGPVWGQLADEIPVIINFHVGVDNEQSEMPVEYALYQNYPNPFNPTTEIRFDLQNTETVKLSVYNVLGKEVTRLVNSRMEAGKHAVQFDARSLASGVYFYRIEAGNFRDMKKMVLVK